MFHELPQMEYPRSRALFSRLPLSLAIDAVIAGNTPGRLWVDDPAQPAAALLWDMGHTYTLAGDHANGSFNAAVRRLVAEPIGRGRVYAKILYDRDGWQEVIPALFAGVPVVS